MDHGNHGAHQGKDGCFRRQARVRPAHHLSTLIGIGVSWAVQINVSDMIRGGADNHDALHVFGYIIGGLAAAGGSSFWHDQLDKVRSAKSIAAKLV